MMRTSVSLENNNLWKRFVALHCFDTKMNDFLSVMGFEASYYTQVHWLKNRRCIRTKENEVDVRDEVFDFRVSRAIVDSTLFLRSVSAGKSLYIFKAPWLFGLANHKHFQLFPSCTSGNHACQSLICVKCVFQLIVG